MYGRLPNPDQPPLSGTGFMTPAPAGPLGATSGDTPHPADVPAKSGSLQKAAASPASAKASKTNPPKRGK